MIETTIPSPDHVFVTGDIPRTQKPASNTLRGDDLAAFAERLSNTSVASLPLDEQVTLADVIDHAAKRLAERFDFMTRRTRELDERERSLVEREAALRAATSAVSARERLLGLYPAPAPSPAPAKAEPKRRWLWRS